jgi:hypothetical protein
LWRRRRKYKVNRCVYQEKSKNFSCERSETMKVYFHSFRNNYY